jgi:hypothetical protein
MNYYYKNRDRCLNYQKKYYKLNLLKHKIYNREYYLRVIKNKPKKQDEAIINSIRGPRSYPIKIIYDKFIISWS